jgi:hypothetical protein
MKLASKSIGYLALPLCDHNFFSDYERTGSAVTKHYSFGGVPVAVRSGSGLFLLYQDGVQSNVHGIGPSGL